MNIGDFVTRTDFEKIRKSIFRKEAFEHRTVYKIKGGEIAVLLKSSEVGDKTAKEIWNGNKYLIHFNENQSGAKLGMKGFGFATCDYDKFDNWDTFKDWFDYHMREISGYEVEEFGQTSLF